MIVCCWLGVGCLACFCGEASKAPPPVPLGKLEPFWRYSAALGPFLEGGQALIEIPDYVLRSDFPYRKRPFPKEVPFADHLSLVRLLGGYSEGAGKRGQADANARDRDLAYRDASGKICYRMELLKPRLQPYLDSGYTNLTLVLDNVPWCFPAQPVAGSGLGQSGNPRDPKEWQEFVRTLCVELKKIFGPQAANQLRFRVGTENNGTARFGGTQAEFFQHYDHAAAAVKAVLPGALFGPFNISGVNLRTMGQQNVNALALADHCFKQPNLANGIQPTPLDWVAYSRYFKPGDDPELHRQICLEVWEEFGRRVPPLKGVSREIHEFGVAPFGEVSKGDFPSAEPGALGAALTAQMMWRLREAGINRLWHWGPYDTFRDRHNILRHFFTSQAWVFSVLEQMAGGQAYLFNPLEKSGIGTSHLMGGSFKDGGALFMLSAYNKDISQHPGETVRFRVPAGLLGWEGKAVRFVQLSPQTAVHDRIRREFAAAGLLEPDFVSRPDRLGGVRQMGKDREAEQLAGDHWDAYARQWVQSLTLQPLNESVGHFTADASGLLIEARMTPPEILVISVK